MPLTLSGTTGIAGVDGSASTPAAQGSDTNTGVFYGTDTVSISTGGVSRMSVDSSGVITGSAGNVLLVSGAAQASTSGTSIDFTGIPSWVKRITLMFNGASTNGTSLVQVQVGSGSVTTSGYISGSNFAGGSAAGSSYNSTSGFLADAGSGSAANLRYGQMTLTLISGNTWVESFTTTGNISGTYYLVAGGGVSPALSGALDRVRVTTVSGTDTFDAGSINVFYE